jgi:hypothetical protein
MLLMFSGDKLPTEKQGEKLCELMHYAFIDLRYLEGKQANDLAYAFHNLPMELYGHGKWSFTTTRQRLSTTKTSIKIIQVQITSQCSTKSSNDIFIELLETQYRTKARNINLTRIL